MDPGKRADAGAEDSERFPPLPRGDLLSAGRLYVVLLTGVGTTLPFARNAPFIQDPLVSRSADPETSPTNRWALNRAGESRAASAMMEWLEQTEDQRGIGRGRLWSAA